MAAIIASLTTYAAPLVGSAAGSLVLAWIIGRFSGSAMFLAIETKLSLAAGKAGDIVSDFGKAKLGATIANPIEDVAAALIGRPIAQFFARLRADNPVKLEKELDYLETVGSKTRAAGIAKKLHDATDAGIAFRGAFGDAHQRLNRFTSESSNSKLKEG